MISHTKMPMTTRSMTAAARRFNAWNTEHAPKNPLYDDEEEEEEILLTCFKCEKKYMGVEGNCCCGKCCSYCT